MVAAKISRASAAAIQIQGPGCYCRCRHRATAPASEREWMDFKRSQRKLAIPADWSVSDNVWRIAIGSGRLERTTEKVYAARDWPAVEIEGNQHQLGMWWLHRAQT